MLYQLSYSRMRAGGVRRRAIIVGREGFEPPYS